MTEIIPAILPKSYDEITEKLDIVSGYVNNVQIDVCDGGYVPNRTWPYLKDHDTIFEEIISQEKALPHWEEINFEFDLMTRNAHEKIPDFISAGASRIIVHKASCDSAELNAIIADYGKHSDEVGVFDIELGIGLMPGDTSEDIKDFVEKIHFVQVMGIEKIGFQGQKMSPKSLELIKSLRAMYPNLVISVDGGVNKETAPKFIEAGANRLVIGSALFGDVDFSGTLNEFEAL